MSKRKKANDEPEFVQCVICNFPVLKEEIVGDLCMVCVNKKEYKEKLEAEWQALSAEDKIAKLRKRIEALESKSRWDGRIG